MQIENIKKTYYKVINFPGIITKKYLKKRIYNFDDNVKLFRQPLILIIIKIILALILISIVYPYHKDLGKILFKIFAFFKLSEIFKFKTPEVSFFIKITRYVFCAVILYHLAIYIYAKVYDIFSSIFLDKGKGKIIYIKNNLIVKKLYFFNIKEIEEIVFQENVLFRFLKIGSIKISMKNGDIIFVKHVYKAYEIIKQYNEELIIPGD